jgi:hypothetical protein
VHSTFSSVIFIWTLVLFFFLLLFPCQVLSFIYLFILKNVGQRIPHKVTCYGEHAENLKNIVENPLETLMITH